MTYFCNENNKKRNDMATENVSTIQTYAFAQFINEIVKQAYKQAYADIQQDIAKQAPRMYTRKEVAERLGVSLPTVHALMNQGILKPTHVGRKPLFKAQDIEEAISTGELRKYKRRGTTQD